MEFPIREGQDHNLFVCGLSEKTVHNVDEFNTSFLPASRNRWAVNYIGQCNLFCYITKRVLCYIAVSTIFQTFASYCRHNLKSWRWYFILIVKGVVPEQLWNVKGDISMFLYILLHRFKFVLLQRMMTLGWLFTELRANELQAVR